MKTLNALMLGVGWSALTAAGAVPPNLVIIHCHDLGQHLGCYGVKTVQTPNLDGFAVQGVRFGQSYCTQPGCSPSRASLFTGRYPHNNGVMGLTHANFAWDLNPEEKHLAQLLRDAGYATAAVGVVHETRSGAKRCGYDKHVNMARVEEGMTAVLAQLKEFVAGAKPFYLYAGFIEPHRLMTPARDGGPGEIGFPGPYLQPDDAKGVEVPGYLRATEGTKRELAGLQGMIKHVDTQFGRLPPALKELNLEANTVVVFTTDHGVAMPRAKCSLYEPGLQVALLLRYPGRAGWHGGVVRQEMISNIDVLPSLLDLLAIPVPANVQGKSFAPLLDGRPYAARTALFGELTYHSYYDPARSVRTLTHKLIANFSSAPSFMDPSQQWRPHSDTVVPANPASAHHPHLELYDLTRDPYEQVDLAGKPAHAKTKEALGRLLYQHMVETSDPLLQGAITGPHHTATLRQLRGG